VSPGRRTANRGPTDRYPEELPRCYRLGRASRGSAAAEPLGTAEPLPLDLRKHVESEDTAALRGRWVTPAGGRAGGCPAASPVPRRIAAAFGVCAGPRMRREGVITPG
jgi:hypothetical protein